MSNLGRWLMRITLRLVAGAGLVAVLAMTMGQHVVGDAGPSTDLEPTPAPQQAVDIVEPIAPAGPVGADGDRVIVGDEPPPPHTLGDDDRLDELWIDCRGGWGYACDRLFEESPIGSEYEQFGVSCGNRPYVLHCQVELDNRPADPTTHGWPLPFPLPSAEELGWDQDVRPGIIE